MIRHLYAFYMQMGSSNFDAETAGAHARQCCILYASLNEEAEEKGLNTLYAMRPKMHLFVEMAEVQSDEAGDPSLFWTYQDEDFMGFIAEMTSVRGGPRNPSTMTFNTLRRYKGLSSD